jgi:cholesterol oxidase
VAFDPRHPEVRHPKSPDAPVITGVMDLWDDQRFIVEDGALPRGLVGLLDLVYALGAVRNPKLPLLTLKRLATYLGFSDVSATRRSVTRGRLEKQLRTFRDHSIEDALVFLMIGDEEPNKTMKLTFLRRLDIRKDENSQQNDRLFEAMRRQIKEFVEKSEAQDEWLPIGDFGPLHKFMTVHPLGGCPMADSAAEGVVNQFGAVHGYGDRYGLFVLDGSILPTAAGMNPAMTIAALAERGAGHLRESGSPPR